MNYFFEIIKRNKIYFSVIGFLLLAIPIGFILFTALGSLPAQQNTTTVSNNKPVSLIKTSPALGALNIGIYEKVSFVFSRPLEPSEQEGVKFTTSPPAAFSSSWNSSQTSLVFAPKTPLVPNQQYTFILSFRGIRLQSSFTTVGIEDVSTKDQIKTQSEADKKYGEYTDSLNQLYPWNQNLPLQSDNYFVYFDPDKKEIIGKLYPQTGEQESIESQAEIMKKDVLLKLAAYGVDTGTVPVSWIITPEP